VAFNTLKKDSQQQAIIFILGMVKDGLLHENLSRMLEKDITKDIKVLLKSSLLEKKLKELSSDTKFLQL